MSRLRIVVTASLILGLGAAGGCPSNEKKELPTDRIRILATTDEHSHLLAVAPEKDEWPLPSATTVRDGKLKGGVARRATVLESERADGIPTVVLSNGDFSQGSLSAVAFTQGNFDVMLMRKLGYDAIALGNHEFDLTSAGLAASVAAAKATGGAPPFVLGNAVNTAGTALDETLGTLYGGVGSGRDIVKGLIVDKGGIKVGIVSAVGPSAAFDGQYTAAPVKFSTAALTVYGGAYVKAANTSIGTILQPTIDALRAGGAEVVVLLFHGGLRSTGSNGDIDGYGTGVDRVDGIVEHLTGVDLIIGGHTHGLPSQLVTYVADADARQVPVMQPAAFGEQIARAEFVVGDARPTFDGARAATLTVDDRTPPTSDEEIRFDLSTAISSIESAVLPGTLSLVTGGSILDDPLVAGDLYFYPLGHTTYDVTGATERAETNALNLDADAMLATAKGLGLTVDVALQNAGSIRGDLVAGDSGTLAFSDVYRMVSLGADPFEQSPGYPLVRAYLPLTELWGAFEQTLQLSYLNNDYYLGSAGVTMEWDPSRTPFNPAAPGPLGWTTKLTIGSTTYYDTSINPAQGYLVNPATIRVPVVTTLLVASFASNVGVHLFASGDTVNDTTPVADLSTLIVEWPVAGSPHVKDHQALARFIRGACLANGGDLPTTYHTTMPVRSTCSRANADPLVGLPCPY